MSNFKLKVGDVIVNGPGYNEEYPFKLQIVRISNGYINFNNLLNGMQVGAYEVNRVLNDLERNYIILCPDYRRQQLIKDLINE